MAAGRSEGGRGMLHLEGKMLVREGAERRLGAATRQEEKGAGGRGAPASTTWRGGVVWPATNTRPWWGQVAHDAHSRATRRGNRGWERRR
jgi:hypothetical protein